MPKRPMEPADLWRIPAVGAPCPSPDGNRLVVPVTTHDVEERESETRLWLHAPGRRPRPITASGFSSTQPAWSPDGSRLAFVRKDENDKTQIFVLDLEGGEPERISDLEEGAINPLWFPGGKKIGFLGRARVEESDEHAHVSEERMPRFWDRWLTDGLRWHLFVWDGETCTDMMPKWAPHFPMPETAGTWDVAPDGREIAFTAGTSKPKAEVRWGAFRMRPGKIPRAVELPEGFNAWMPRYSPDGRSILIGIKDDPRSWASRTQLAVVDRRSGKLEVLAPKWDLRANDWAWDGRRVLGIADVEGRTAVYRVRRKGEPVELWRGGSLSALAVAGGRIWVKLTAPYRISAEDDLPYTDVEPLAKALREARADRLLWGSDWPHAINKKPMANDGDLFDLLAAWLPDEGLRTQVLAENPKRLYGFD